MEITYQFSRKDYRNFLIEYAISIFAKNFVRFFIISSFIAIVAGTHPFDLLKLTLAFIITFLSLVVTLFILPYVISYFKIKKQTILTDDYFGEKKLILSNTSITGKTVNRTSEWIWESVKSVSSTNHFIIISLINKQIIVIPMHSFASNEESLNFQGIIQANINKLGGTQIGNQKIPTEKSLKSIYLFGLLCLIPLVGAIAGLIFIILGIVKFKDKWLIVIGLFGVLFTLGIYGCLFYFSKNSNLFKEGFVQLSQKKLNDLVHNVEFYKIQTGQYPDSLQQLIHPNSFVTTYDPLQANQKNNNYNYRKIGEKYQLFSSGKDGVPNTNDDLFPQITITDSSKIGFIKSK